MRLSAKKEHFAEAENKRKGRVRHPSLVISRKSPPIDQIDEVKIKQILFTLDALINRGREEQLKLIASLSPGECTIIEPNYANDLSS